MLDLFIKGIILGLSVSIPVGPIGLLCIDRTIQKHFWSGLFSGLGAATADMLYGLIAAFGISFISNLFVTEEVYIQFFGGILLVIIGVRSFRLKPGKTEDYVASRKNHLKDFLSAFVLTITNPGTILFFMAVFTGFGFTSSKGDIEYTGILVGGIFLGSVIWWLTLSGTTFLLKPRINDKFLTGLNHLSSTAIMLFGIIILLALLF